MENITTKESNVLFQKLGNTWYIFTEIEGEFLYSTLPEGMDPKKTNLELYEVIDNHMKMIAKHNKRTGQEPSLAG
jgi:hypothetical protein